MVKAESRLQQGKVIKDDEVRTALMAKGSRTIKLGGWGWVGKSQKRNFFNLKIFQCEKESVEKKMLKLVERD